MRNFIKGYSRWCTKTLVEANATITKNKKIGGQVQDAMRCISCVTSVMMNDDDVLLLYYTYDEYWFSEKESDNKYNRKA